MFTLWSSAAMTPPQTAASSRDPWMNSTVGAPSILVALQVKATLPSTVLPPTITAFCRRTRSSEPSLLSSQPVPRVGNPVRVSKTYSALRHTETAWTEAAEDVTQTYDRLDGCSP